MSTHTRAVERVENAFPAWADPTDEDTATALVDHLADLMHFAHARGFDFETALGSAARHVDHELPGQEDDIAQAWSAVLEDES